MQPLRPPVRIFVPRNTPVIDIECTAPAPLSPSKVEAPEYELREIEGEVAETIWMDSVFADELQTAFPDSQVQPFLKDVFSL